MPILVKDYCWQQTDKYVTITLPLKEVHKKHVDILTTKNYIKAHYPPYFFEIFVSKPIDDVNSNCFITDNEVIFELCKTEPEIWDELEVNIDKANKIELKKKYLEQLQNDEQARDKLKINKHASLKRVAVKEQIKIDSNFRNTVAEIKKTVTQEALIELDLCDESSRENKSVSVPKLTADDSDIVVPLPPTQNRISQYSVVKKIHPTPIPLLRKSQSVDISFTARLFPTPSRESKAKEEEEWLVKQTEARRTCGFVDEDLRPEERNPQWLKDKGDEFFKLKNYLGAISAYSTGIQLSKNYVSLYINRSAAHMALGNLNKTINDCTTALELMTPVCQANLEQRAKCLARRGAALAQLGLLKEGAGEIEAALKLMPKNETLKQDLEKIKNQIIA